MSYDNFASTFSKSRKNLKWPEIDYIKDFLQTYFGEKEPSILDVGCGNGRLLESISPTKNKYLGIDESKNMIEEAKKLHEWYSFETLDMNALDQVEKKFDVILFIASFHHLASERERILVLEKTKKILEDGGVIIMTNWNLLGENVFPRYENVYSWWGDFQIKIGAFSRYYHGFTEGELEKIFKENNLSIEEQRIFTGGKNILSIVRQAKK